MNYLSIFSFNRFMLLLKYLNVHENLNTLSLFNNNVIIMSHFKSHTWIKGATNK